MTGGILAGVRVLDLTDRLSGPYCTMMLADHGADVIRVDTTRETPRPASLNRNKKSVLLALDTPEGKDALLGLAATAHVVVESLAPGEMARLGLGYEVLAQVNPALVYGAIPPRVEPAEDPGDDRHAGMMMAFGLIAALRQSEATGKGQVVDLAGDTLQASDATTGPEGERWDIPAPLRFSQNPAPEIQGPPRIGADTDTYLSEMPPMPMSEADKRALRDAFGAFATGVTVVTTLQPDGTPRGFTANSFTSVSLDPPMVLVCVAKSALSCAIFVEAPHFAVNVLAEEQTQVSGIFASRDPDKFDRVGWDSGAAGMPVLKDTLASIVCARDRAVDAGDHVILLGRVIDHTTGTSARPLGFFKGSYFSVGVEDDLVNAATRAGAVEIGALLVRGRQLLMKLEPDGKLGLPKAPGKRPGLPALNGELEQLGMRPKLDFLYAIYRDSVTGHHGIFYHGTVAGLTPPGYRFIGLIDIPLAKVANPAERSMLSRFIDEFQHGNFGIYQGDETRGLVQRVTDRAPSKTASKPPIQT